jgi:hypothetical protein
MTGIFHNHFCYTIQHPDGRSIEVYSENPKLETLLTIMADRVHYAPTEDFPVLGVSGEHCIIELPHHLIDQVIKLTRKHANTIQYIQSQGVKWQHPRLNSIYQEI